MNEKIQINIEEVMGAGTSEYARCQRLRDRVINAEPYICTERAEIVTRVYKDTEADDSYKRRAKAMKAVFEEMSLFILKDELIVGHTSSRQKGGPIYPEFSIDWIVRELDDFSSRDQDRMILTDEARKSILEKIAPYWTGRTLKDRMLSNDSPDVTVCKDVVITIGFHEDSGLGHVYLDWGKLLRLGLGGIIKEMQGELDAITEWTNENLHREKFYRCSIAVCKAVITYANRYADLAESMAEEETDPKRKEELLGIARNCRKVPEFPAESFYEAVQSFWLLEVSFWINDNGMSFTPGRFDQYMYPYYEKDILSGKLTKVKAQEILESMWVKFVEQVKLTDYEGTLTSAGYPMGQNLCVSGIGQDGKDATNDLSYRCLEAHSHMLLAQPNFSVRLHNRSPQELLKRTCEVIKRGSGMPQLVNDQVYIPAMTSLGVSLKEARDYAPVGCVEISPLHTWGRLNSGYVNLPKILELALHDGKCQLTGVQMGSMTGDPREFDTFDEVLEAFRKQMFYCSDIIVKWNNRIDMVHEEMYPCPLVSAFVDDCIKLGRDVTSGGAKYNWSTPYGVGVANAANSLTAINELVFKQKKYSMGELLDMVDNNYDGYEDLRQFIVNRLPKYGNDDPVADEMVTFVSGTYFDSLENRKCYRNDGPFAPAMIPVTAYVGMGKVCAASADGRKSKEPLADGISPSSGTDRHGPTAAIKSVNAIDHIRCTGGEIYNQMFNPTTVATEEGMRKWIDLIRTHIALENGQIQFNIIDADTLLDAQEHPEDYKGLVVRVAGYSAFFNVLSKNVQDTIIERTKQAF